MIITYGGLEFFKIQSGNLTLAFNPVSKDSKSKIQARRFKTDIALITLNHSDFNGAAGLSGKDDKKPFIIDSAGEYEIEEVFVKGFNSTSFYGGEKRINTIYRVTLENITLCFLGALDDKDISDNILGEIESPEILFVPIGGDGVLNASDAHKLSVKLSPNVIIPMHYGSVGEKDSLKKFLKEEGVSNGKPEEKLSVKKNTLSTKSGEIIVLKSLSD